MLERLGLALLIFSLRVCDVALGTLRTSYVVRGRRGSAAALGFVEALVWMAGISRAMAHLNDPLGMLAWAAGFAGGIAAGMSLDRRIASGWVTAQVFVKDDAPDVEAALRAAHFGLTSVDAQGKDGPVRILYVVAKRRRGGELLAQLRAVAPEAFVTIANSSPAMGGFLARHAPDPGALRK